MSWSWGALGSSNLVTNNGPQNTLGSQATITWSRPGAYLVTLTVTDRFGHSMTGIRQVKVYQDCPTAEGSIIDLQLHDGAAYPGDPAT